MKQYSLLLLLAVLSVQAKENNEPKERISEKEIVDHAQFWVKELPDLTQDELNLLANYLYFQCLTNYAESAARSLLISIHDLSIIMNKQLVNDEQEACKTAIYNSNQLRHLKEEILPLRRNALGSFSACIKEIESSNLRTVKEIIVNLQGYAHAVTTQMIKQDKETIIKTLEKGLEALDNNLEKLQTQKELLEKVLNNENPYIKEGADEDVANFELGVYLSDVILAHINEITLPATAMKQMSCDILNINLFINKQFYNCLLDSLPKSKKNKVYRLFNTDGKIEEEELDELLSNIDKDFTLDKKYFA